MKKLILSAAIVLGGLTAVSAQTDKEAKSLSHAPQTVEEVAPRMSTAVQDYKEVKVSELPQSVKDQVAENFKDATVSKAYVNAKGEYKIHLANANQKDAVVYTDAKGKLVLKELKKQ